MSSNNGPSSYFWAPPPAQNSGYYTVPPPNFAPPDLSLPPPTFSLPPPSLSENKLPVVPVPQFQAAVPPPPVPSYSASYNSYQQPPPSYSFQQPEPPYGSSSCIPNYPPPAPANFNYSWNADPGSYASSSSTEWGRNAVPSSWNNPVQNRDNAGWNGPSPNDSKKNVARAPNRPATGRKYTERGGSVQSSHSEMKSTDRTLDRRRSRSPEGRSPRNVARPYRSRAEEHRNRYEKYSRGRFDGKESSCDGAGAARRSSSRSSVYSSRSTTIDEERLAGTGRSRQRSRSRESQMSIVSSPSSNASVKPKNLSEREELLKKYRRNYCATSIDMERKMDELSAIGVEGLIEIERKVWTRTAPADLYYVRDENNPKIMRGTQKLTELCDIFKELLVDRAAAARAQQPPYEPPPRKTRARLCRHKSEACSSSSSDSDSSMDEDDRTMEELMAKKQHPQRLHPEMWFNDPGEMNDGPLCRCSAKSRRSGIRHGIYAGEGIINRCDVDSNNADKLYHYRITISPPTNFLTKTPTIIKHDEHEFIFEGFSMLSHFPLIKLPTCKVIRFNIEYTILYIDEKLPESFTIRELDLFQDYLFKEVLELVDFDLQAAQDKSGCGQFHFMPRFVRDLPENGQEILSMNEVLNYLIKSSNRLIDPEDLPRLMEMPQYKWQNFADEVKGMVVTYPGKKPCSVRVDQLDRSQGEQPPGVIAYPEIVHFGIRPPQLSYAGNADYQKAWRDYVKFRHLLANMPKPSFEDKRKLEVKENKLQELRTQSKMKRDVTVDVSSEGFYRTGIMCDIVQHAMLIPVLVCHLRFHKSLDILEKTLGYSFDNRYLLQLALTHPSYRENFGTNPDHARNSLTNCGIRQPEYGDRRIHYMNTRKRGINTLINIMSRFGARRETESSIAHNERLEFLGDAVVEFLTSIHLFHMFPDLEEGGLATYRAAIVQNQHLAVLAKKLNLEQYMLYAHGSDLCHDLELRHAMANCFEALMGSLFLDGGIEVADRIFGDTLFQEEDELGKVWVCYPKHPLQEQEPTGDRQWIPSFELLQKLTKFEDSIGVDFMHIRLLARAFTDRSIGYTNLTLGSNQRLEFLGDTVLQLIVSEYLYKFFPEHHEGHLSLLRSSLVNNKTQAVVCDDLGMTQYALYGNPKAELKTKDRADLLEAFLGALYVDKGLEFCHVFCDVCFFPRLQDFIMNQDWNDPKSKLQQCCLTLRTMDGGEPDIPVYKVIECKGPTNTRVYTVAVYFQGKRLAKASGHSIQEAEMNSAKEALEKSQGLFPQLDHQKRVIAKSMKKQQWPNRQMLRGKPTRPADRSDESDSSQARKRRSRSRERESSERKLRDRYDSADRRYRRYRSPERQSAAGSKRRSRERQRNDSRRREDPVDRCPEARKNMKDRQKNSTTGTVKRTRSARDSSNPRIRERGDSSSPEGKKRDRSEARGDSSSPENRDQDRSMRRVKDRGDNSKSEGKKREGFKGRGDSSSPEDRNRDRSKHSVQGCSDRSHLGDKKRNRSDSSSPEVRNRDRFMHSVKDCGDNSNSESKKRDRSKDSSDSLSLENKSGDKSKRRVQDCGDNSSSEGKMYDRSIYRGGSSSPEGEKRERSKDRSGSFSPENKDCETRRWLKVTKNLPINQYTCG